MEPQPTANTQNSTHNNLILVSLSGSQEPASSLPLHRPAEWPAEYNARDRQPVPGAAVGQGIPAAGCHYGGTEIHSASVDDLSRRETSSTRESHPPRLYAVPPGPDATTSAQSCPVHLDDTKLGRFSVVERWPPATAISQRTRAAADYLQRFFGAGSRCAISHPTIAGQDP